MSHFWINQAMTSVGLSLRRWYVILRKEAYERGRAIANIRNRVEPGLRSSLRAKALAANAPVKHIDVKYIAQCEACRGYGYILADVPCRQCNSTGYMEAA